mgnify:CR=1 FL=1
MFASMQNVPKIITKVNHISLDGVIEKANVDTVITPHKIAANQVVKYVRAMQNGQNSSCEAVYKFDDDEFETCVKAEDRRSIAFTRNTTSRGLNGFTM